MIYTKFLNLLVSLLHEYSLRKRFVISLIVSLKIGVLGVFRNCLIHQKRLIVVRHFQILRTWKQLILIALYILLLHKYRWVLAVLIRLINNWLLDLIADFFICFRFPDRFFLDLEQNFRQAFWMKFADRLALDFHNVLIPIDEWELLLHIWTNQGLNIWSYRSIFRLLESSWEQCYRVIRFMMLLV